MARESLVLLKNRLETLPLKKSGTIAVVGPLADSKRDVMGSWSAAGVADQSVTVLTGIRSAVAGKGNVVYAKGANVTDDKDIVTFLNQYEEAVKVDPRTPKEMIDEAVARRSSPTWWSRSWVKRRVWRTKPPAAPTSPSRRASAI